MSGSSDLLAPWLKEPDIRSTVPHGRLRQNDVYSNRAFGYDFVAPYFGVFRPMLGEPHK